jgi:shikimate dehydrogenase
MSVSSRPGNFGALIFNQLFKFHKINAVYIPRLSKAAEEIAAALRALDASGCAISSPLKSEIIRHLDQLDSVSKDTCSVNTILNRDGQLHGFNTDVYGMQKVLMGCAWNTALIYGSGSVVSSTISALRMCKFTDISVVARRKCRAESIAAERGVSSDWSSFDLLINATPASLDPVNRELFDLSMNAKAVFDLVVSPEDTPLILKAKSLNLQTIRGIEMSKWQLQKQFELYTDITLDISEIEEIIRKSYR